MLSPAPLRLVVIAPDNLVPDGSDDTEQLLAERSRQLRIGLLENGYNVVAVLPTDTFLRERIAQLQPDMIIVDAESAARDALEHVVMGAGYKLTLGADARLQAFLLAGDIRAEAWIRTLLQDELPAQAYGRLLLSPGAKPPVAVQPRSKPVCSCFNVTEAQIEGCLAHVGGPPPQRLALLQAELKCGTNCGSCIPELKRLVHLAATAVQP